MLNQAQLTSPQSNLQTYMNTPRYALLNGANGIVNNAALSPQDRFQASPGYQYALNEAQRHVNNVYAGKGLINSGAALNASARAAEGLAQQDWYNWQDRQNNMYTQYMTDLGKLTDNQANFKDAELQAQQGNNTASLYTNQGTAGLGAYTNTAGAMAGLTMQEGAMLAQIQAAQAANQGSQASSALGSLFSLLGSNGGLGGGINSPNMGNPNLPVVADSGYGSGGGGAGGGGGGGGGGGSSGGYYNDGSTYAMDRDSMLAGRTGGGSVIYGNTDEYGLSYDDPNYAAKRSQMEVQQNAWLSKGSPTAADYYAPNWNANSPFDRYGNYGG